VVPKPEVQPWVDRNKEYLSERYTYMTFLEQTEALFRFIGGFISIYAEDLFMHISDFISELKEKLGLQF